MLRFRRLFGEQAFSLMSIIKRVDGLALVYRPVITDSCHGLGISIATTFMIDSAPLAPPARNQENS